MPLTDQTPEPPEGTSAYAQPKPEPALLLGRYRIVEQCGTGGFGRVLVCWDTRLQRRVAIKVIPLRMGVDEASAETTMKEALAEARTSSLLAHPNIVTVYDFESDNHYAYLVMEYVDGLNLAQLLKRVEGGTLTYEECAHLLQSVASALEFAHENGVLHLDIKPSNIMIDRRGQVKLADFGMSTLASAAGWGGARGGTVGFMPPEQIQGMLVDERTDIFSLGVVIWLALCGENPFQAAIPEESLKKIFRGAAPSLTENHLELDQNIELVLERTLEPDPTNRLASAELLSKRLVPLLGSPKEGQESLAALVQQAEDGTEDEETWTERYVEKTPARERFPWLEGALVRTVTALLAGAVLWRILPWVVPADTGTLVLLALAGAGAGAAWPPLGSLAVLGAFVLALAETGAGGLSMLVALGTAAIGFAWWWAAGRKQRLAGASLLLAPALGIGFGSSALAGFALSPGAAAITAALAGLFERFLLAAIATGFAPEALLSRAGAWLALPSSWILVFSWGAAASAASLCAKSGRRGLEIFGQCLCAGLLVFFQALSVRVENSGIWAAPDMTAILIAIFLSVVMCIISVLMGPEAYRPEG